MPDPVTPQSYATDESRWRVLMEKAQGGDEASYRRLLREISGVAARYIGARTIGSSEIVEDCVQEVLLAVHQARHTYNPARPFRPWLFAIVRHKAFDQLRRSRNAQREVSLEVQRHDRADPGDDMESSLVRDELLHSLAEPAREAITLTKLQGLTAAEAAERLQISESAVKVRVHRGVKQLRNLMRREP